MPPPTGNKSLFDFFKPVQAPPKPATAPNAQTFFTPRTAPISHPTKTPTTSKSPPPSNTQSQSAKTPPSSSTLSDEREASLSLSPPPSSMSEPPISPLKENVPFRPIPNVHAESERVIQNSDDEDESSESDVEDLGAYLAARSAERARQAGIKEEPQIPSTPVVVKPESRRNDFHRSPMAVLSKPKFKIDMKELLRHVKEDEAAEASSKRVKAMLAARNDDEDDVPKFSYSNSSSSNGFAHEALLDSVVAEREGVEADKVKRALKRTEATITEKRWYFFDPKASPSRQQPFPTAKIPKNWQADLVPPSMRYHTFISGFAEDMVGLGKVLPDELFLWILDEICFEPSLPLRNSYMNVLKASTEQSGRLIDPKTIQALFVNIGASSSSNAAIVTSKVKPVQKLASPYAHRDWSSLLSIVKLLGGLASSLKLATKMCSVCMLLRMSMDRLVSDNIDIWDSIQKTISRLCLSIKDEDDWTTCCTQICKILFDSVNEPTLRVQILEVIPSTHPRTHDLRRRLAMSFYYNDASYSTHHSHTIMDIKTFIGRLSAKEFDTSPKTDYRELSALIRILDIALDDGRSTNLDLSISAIETEFNDDVDALCTVIKNLMKSLGTPGAAFISKIEAKEIMDLVSQRIESTVRSKRKPTHTWFDPKTVRKEEDLESEQKGMAAFMTRMKTIDGNR